MRKRSHFLTRLIGLLFLLFFLLIAGCGIYATLDPLNPPFDQIQESETLTFSGFNTESYFSGYVLWYRETTTGLYKVCGYKNDIPFPTIPKGAGSDIVQSDDLTGEDPPKIKYIIDIKDLYPQDNLNKSFVDLNRQEDMQFYIAVSAYGENDEQSEKIEFGKWPAFE
jgi:hypothetical protein